MAGPQKQLEGNKGDNMKWLVNLIDWFNHSRWSSRKFLLALFTLVFIVLTEVLGYDVDGETYWQLIGIVSAYILGESIVDTSKK